MQDAVVVPTTTKDPNHVCAFVDAKYTEFEPDTYQGLELRIGIEGKPQKFSRNPDLTLQEAFEENYRSVCEVAPTDIDAYFMSSVDHFISDAKIDTSFMHGDGEGG